MKNFLTNLAIKYLYKNDFIIINRAIIAEEKHTLKLTSCFLSYIKRYKQNALFIHN